MNLNKRRNALDTPAEIKVIGVMVGSSMDGIDLAAVKFSHLDSTIPTWELVSSAWYPLNKKWKDRMAKAREMSISDFFELDADFGAFLGSEIARFRNEGALDYEFASIHGWTAVHSPKKRYSVQLGSGAVIAETAGMTVITDLRSGDIAAGGQGAPLAPIADRDLFPGYTFYLNLGGIANISHVSESGGPVYSSDLAGCNQILNVLAQAAGQEFDEDGNLAKQGKLHRELFKALGEDAFPIRGSAFSLDNAEVQNVIRFLDSFILPPGDKLHTYVEFLSYRILNWISQFTEGMPDAEQTLLCTGGGAHNSYLLERIKACCAEKQVQVIKPDDATIDFKEAILFAWLGALRLLHLPNALPEATGALRPTVNGAVYLNS